MELYFCASPPHTIPLIVLRHSKRREGQKSLSLSLESTDAPLLVAHKFPLLRRNWTRARALRTTRSSLVGLYTFIRILLAKEPARIDTPFTSHRDLHRPVVTPQPAATMPNGSDVLTSALCPQYLPTYFFFVYALPPTRKFQIKTQSYFFFFWDVNRLWWSPWDPPVLYTSYIVSELYFSMLFFFFFYFILRARPERALLFSVESSWY